MLSNCLKETLNPNEVKDHVGGQAVCKWSSQVRPLGGRGAAWGLWKDLPVLLLHHHSHKAHYSSSRPVQSSVFWILKCHMAPPL